MTIKKTKTTVNFLKKVLRTSPFWKINLKQMWTSFSYRYIHLLKINFYFYYQIWYFLISSHVTFFCRYLKNITGHLKWKGSSCHPIFMDKLFRHWYLGCYVAIMVCVGRWRCTFSCHRVYLFQRLLWHTMEHGAW